MSENLDCAGDEYSLAIGGQVAQYLCVLGSSEVHRIFWLPTRPYDNMGGVCVHDLYES